MQRPKYQKNVSRETIPRNPLPFFTRAGSDFQIRTPERASCAQCAPESLPKAAELVLRMFQLHEHRPREAASMFRLVRVESEGTRGDRSMFRLQDRASPESSEALPYKNPIIPHRTPPAADNSRPKVTPNSSLLTPHS